MFQLNQKVIMKQYLISKTHSFSLSSCIGVVNGFKMYVVKRQSVQAVQLNIGFLVTLFTSTIITMSI